MPHDENVPTANMVANPSDHSEDAEHPDWNSQHGVGREVSGESGNFGGFDEIYEKSKEGEKARRES